MYLGQGHFSAEVFLLTFPMVVTQIDTLVARRPFRSSPAPASPTELQREKTGAMRQHPGGSLTWTPTCANRSPFKENRGSLLPGGRGVEGTGDFRPAVLTPVPVSSHRPAPVQLHNPG